MERKQLGRLALETTALGRPGRERGLGRYTDACFLAASELASEVVQIQLPQRNLGRAAEFIEFADRTVRVRRAGVDLFHATNPYAACLPGTPQIVSVLDLIPLEVASHRQTGLKARTFFNFARRADSILTLSEFSADRISEVLRYPREQIFVAPLQPSAVFSSHPSMPPAVERFALAVVDMATPDPRKRAYWITNLAKRLKSAGVPLRVVGAGTETALSAVDNVVGLGRLPDEELASLYRRCGCFCYFSAYEGQGLPPLEAMTAGAPVIAMANSAVTEIVGPGGVLLDEPGETWAAEVTSAPWMQATITEMADIAIQLVTDPTFRASVTARGAEQSARFTWDRFRSGLSDAYTVAS